MEILRTLNTNGAGDSDLDQLDNWPDMSAEGIWLDGELPVTVGTGGTPAVSDLRNVLDYFLGLVSVKYKLGSEFAPYDGVSGSILRNIHRLMTLKEVFNDFVGVVQTTGAKTFRVRLYLTPNRQQARSGKRRLIGPTQGRTFEVSIKEGDALTAGALNLSRTAAANAVWRIVPEYAVGPDKFSHLPFYREVNRAALDVSGPDGKHLAVWDDNAAFGSTAIGKYRLKLGEHELVRLVEPKYVDQEYARNIDAGGSDVTDEVTLFYAADPFADERELVTGAPYIKLVNQDVATILARFLYFPSISAADALSIVGAAAVESGDDINAQVDEPADDPHKNGHAAVSPIEFVRRTDARFSTEAGLMASKDARTVTPFVPPSAVAMAHALKGASGSGEAMARRVQKLRLLRIPGVTTTSGKGVGTIRNAARSAFSSLF